MSFIITPLPETVAEHGGGVWSASTVLQHMALYNKHGERDGLDTSDPE